MPTKETEETKETKTQCPLKIFDYFGFSIYYRIEQRKEPALCLSIRDEHGNIVYEWSPHRYPKSCKGDDTRALKLLTPRFVLSLLGDPVTKDGSDRREKCINDGCYTFGLVCVAHMALLLQTQQWGSETYDKYMRLLQPLLKEYGMTPMEEFTPIICIASLEKMSYENHRTCSNFFKRIFLAECGAGACKKDPWAGYQPRERRKKGKTIENLRQRELSTGQCRAIMQICWGKIAKTKNATIYLLAAFLLLMGLKLEELCALTRGNLKRLEEPKGCLGINITSERYQPKGSKQYKTRPIANVFQRRILILPDTLAFLLQRLYPTLIDFQEDSKTAQFPLFPDPKDPQHFMRPDRVSEMLDSFFGTICGRPEFGRELSVAKRMIKTAQHNMQRVGLHKDQMCYHYGWTPKSTSAEYYNGFASASQLNRRRRILNLWAKEIRPASLTKAMRPPQVAHHKSFFPEPGKLCELNFRLASPSEKVGFLSSEALLSLSAEGGFQRIRIVCKSVSIQQEVNE